MLKFENKSNGRYYYITTERDIFNDLVLTVIRGGIHGRCVRHYGFNCQESIIREINRLTKLRIKRGYTLVSN